MTNILNPLVNPPPLQEQCVVTLHTMVKNVADHPTDPKYRRVKASSRSITQKVVACRGGEEFLTAAGWRKVAIDYEGVPHVREHRTDGHASVSLFLLSDGQLE